MKIGEKYPLNILTIDTSTDIELIALSVDGKIFQYCDYTKMSHSITMFDNLSSLLSQAEVKINEIDIIGTGIGPGSFTGIRIAVSTARMFAQILKIPLVGIKSQEIYAASVQEGDNKTILTAFDAKKSRVFAGAYTLNGSATNEIIEPGDYYMEEILESIKKRKDIRDIICIGDGCERYIDIIDNFSKKTGFFYTNIDNFLPNGKAACELTLKKYNESHKKYIDFEDTIPFYARKSDAELSKSKI
ncbi:MAG: tRNA (adenosine(37)-N6)-threonylcarbamoyltransferase complex dimerization subunit type 1 TsaB [Spirochaetes bacterium]|nr:tRNA (adenosine(37)-N6)-threonylcarbamoyltransferase complex dimerization subunit type 1 TsaB [Spirochaetota bacterium]